MIAALEKAHSLAKFARASGARLDTFALTLTESEAYELLDYLAAGEMGKYENHERLIADVQKAKQAKDPFPMLEWFTLEGLSIWPKSALH